MRVAELVATALFASTAIAQADQSSWQAQFSAAPSWTAYAVKDDSGATDNTVALNALPANVPIKADCPHSGYVSFSGTWHWLSGLTVWQQPGCVLKSTIVTPGVYPIVSGPSAGEISSVQYYGMKFSFVTPTSAVRVMLAWIDHFKFENFDINGSGGFAFLRGSDQEIAFGTMENTIAAPGNPGIRHFGNIPQVMSSPGMPANDWFHELNFQTGDGTFQACQPNSIPTGWGYNVSTDGILYQDSYGISSSSAVQLVNEDITTNPGDTYYCNNVSFENVSGAGLWYAVILPGNANSQTNNVTLSGGKFNGAGYGNSLAAIGIGGVTYGGSAPTGTAISNINISGISVSGAYQQSLKAVGAFSGSITNSVFGSRQHSGPANVDISQAPNIQTSNNTISP